MAETVYSINGPVVTVLGSTEFSMLEMVYVGKKRLVGEVISISDEKTTIQVYESTSGLAPGEEVIPTGSPMSVDLGPGIISGIFDGIGRPLKEMANITGPFIGEGNLFETLDKNKEYDLSLKVKVGDTLSPGQVYAVCEETQALEHRLLCPPGVSGRVESVAPEGKHKIDDVIVTLKSDEGKEEKLTMSRKWPIRQPRPVAERLFASRPLITGQRVIDTVFPVAKGGVAAIPGGFGTGKTMTQHQLAKWCDADIIVYIGCGERGNEMTQVLKEFSQLDDPKTGKKLTDRTILIANTSNMPVAAREASIYTGITFAEYYRDMGYHVAVMADSTSRWAEALREISGRLEEMPAEEGFPAYLPSRLSQFYERAGYVKTLGGNEGSITVIGAVSPQGSDFSEPVTQNTKRFVRTFWALDKSLAYERHYPAINWMSSYSEYIEDLEDYYEKELGNEFKKCREKLISYLALEAKLMEIVKLIGSDVLPDDQKLVMETAKTIREGFLQQNAYHSEDTYVPLEKQFLMMKLIIYLHEKAASLLSAGVPFSSIIETGLFSKLSGMKYDIPNGKPEMFDEYKEEIDKKLAGTEVEI